MDLTSVIMLATLVSGLYLAWNMGANDVANAVGPSLGSRSMALWQAILIAAVFEAIGAVFAGGSVTRTVSAVIRFDHGLTAQQIATGLCACLLSAALWLNLSSVLRLPASTTHAIVGALIGFGLIAGGVDAVHWSVVWRIGWSWLASPIIAAILAFFTVRALRDGVFEASEPVRRMQWVAPLLVGLIAVGMAGGFLAQTPGWRGGLISGVIGVGAVIATALLWRRVSRAGTQADQAERVEAAFGIMQALAVAFITFAHGSNDVANAVGPMAMAAAVLHDGPSGVVEVSGPMLVIGVVGIVIGIATYGYRVMSTVGREITPLTRFSGFSALLSAAMIILLCSALGLPVSTAHTIVGAIVGVGFARGVGAINLRVIRGILAGWALAVPVTAGLAAGLAWLLGAAG